MSLKLKFILKYNNRIAQLLMDTVHCLIYQFLKSQLKRLANNFPIKKDIKISVHYFAEVMSGCQQVAHSSYQEP